MSQERITEVDVEKALAGESVSVPLADGRVIRLWYGRHKLHLTSTVKKRTLKGTDMPGRGEATISSP